MAIFSMVLSLLSGVALFLFGMSLMGDGLKLVAGNKLEAFLYRNDKHSAEGRCTGNRCNECNSVLFSNDRYGYWFRKLRYDETETGNRYHHGSKHRNQYYRLDTLPFLYSGIRRYCQHFIHGNYFSSSCGNRYYLANGSVSVPFTKISETSCLGFCHSDDRYADHEWRSGTACVKVKYLSIC